MDKNTTLRTRGTDLAKVVYLIQTTAMRGSGEENDPVREVVQYWSFDGELLWEKISIS